MEPNAHDITADDEQAIVAFMRRLAADCVAEHNRLPDAYVVWWKAELLRRWDAERKVATPLDVIEPLQWAAGSAACLLLMWTLQSLLRSATF
jgi:hypothetical protein